LSRRARILRLALGFVFAPLTPIVILLVISVGSGSIQPSESALMIAVGVPAVYAATIMFGVPMFLLLRWRRWNSLIAYAIGGALIGVAICAVTALLSGSLRAMPADMVLQVRGFLPFVVASAFSASWAFWLIVRPDRFEGRFEGRL
jgi:hypothetical protein